MIWSVWWVWAYMLLEVFLKSTQMPVSPTAFHPSHVETDRQRSITVPLYQQSLPPSGQTSPGVARTLPPLRTSSLEHLPSHADECKSLAYDRLELSQRPHSCNDPSLRNSDAVQWFFDINIWKYTWTLSTQKVRSKTSFKVLLKRQLNETLKYHNQQ